MFTIKMTCIKLIATIKLINVFFKLENESKQKLQTYIKTMLKILDTATIIMLQCVGIMLLDTILIKNATEVGVDEADKDSSHLLLSVPFCVSTLAHTVVYIGNERYSTHYF